MSFIHATFLAAGLAIAVPWLLHLTKKRKYLRIRLGSLQFLDPIVRDRKRMSRVEQWPLLIARCLAVLLLALLFSRPFFPKPSPPPPAAGEFIVLLDASGSITPQQADIIRKQAEKTVAAMPQSTRPVFVAVSDQVEIIPALETYQPIPGSPGAFTRAVDWIVDRAAGSPDAIAGVHWFTDLQRVSLPAAPSRLWPSGLPVEIHSALPPTDRNVSVGSIDLLTPFGGDKWEVEARVHVHGMPATGPVAVRLTTSEGAKISMNAPQDGGTVRFQWEGQAPGGILSGTVSLPGADDSWPADDTRPFAFPATQPKRVVLVDGDPGNSPFASETYFMEKALHASAAGKTLSPFRATVATSIPKESEAVDVIALCNVNGISSAETRLLRSHLERGCGLAIFLGDECKPAAWAAAIQAGLLPAGLREFPEAAPAFIRRSETTHPALAGLTTDSARSLALLPLLQRFAWPVDPKWKNLMEFDAGVPLAAVSESGKIVVFAHPVNRQGSDLPLSPSFVPLMQGLFADLARPAATGGTVAIHTRTPGQQEQRVPGLYPENSAVTLVIADGAEADIANAGEKSFRELLGLPAADAPAPVVLPAVATQASTHQREGELWPWILALLLALLTLESALASRRIHPTVTTDAHVN